MNCYLRDSFFVINLKSSLVDSTIMMVCSDDGSQCQCEHVKFCSCGRKGKIIINFLFKITI